MKDEHVKDVAQDMAQDVAQDTAFGARAAHALLATPSPRTTAVFFASMRFAQLMQLGSSQPAQQLSGI